MDMGRKKKKGTMNGKPKPMYSESGASPTSTMLGTGTAAGAAKKIQKRKKRQKDMLDQI